MKIKKLRAAIARREASTEGILPAAAYVAGMAHCFANEHCARLFDGTISPAQVAHTLKDSRKRLTYRCADMEVKSTCKGVRGSILDFTCVVTSTRKDRDKDVLESEGAILDEKMPLLWQHMPPMPIGKFVALVSQNKSQVVGSYAIADTALGRDAATLVEFEALRISHGFRPLKFERIASRTRGGPPEGFHVFTFEVMETSLVSVPSNRDAVVTAFSRQKLHSPLVKSWAGGLMAGRPVLVTSGWAKTPKTTTACDGSCSRRIHRRFRRRLRAGRGPGRKTLKSMRTALRTAIGVQATKALLAPAQSGSFSKPACVCSVDLAPGKGRLARGVMASLTTGNVGLGVLDQTRKAIKKALQRDKTFAPPPPRGSAEHRLLCQHEAAHAVLGLLMGVPIKEATVAGTKDTQGHVRLDAAGFAKLSTAEAVALNLAGFAAESWARPDDAPPDLSGQTDRKTARKGLAALSRGPVPKAAVEGLARRLGELFLRIPGVCDATRSVAALLEGSPSGQVAGGRVELAAREAIGDARWAAVGSHLRERAADIVNDVARNHRPRTAA